MSQKFSKPVLFWKDKEEELEKEHIGACDRCISKPGLVKKAL